MTEDGPTYDESMSYNAALAAKGRAMTTPKEILPCPFCGSDPADQGGWIYCEECDIATGKTDWNRRAAPSAEPVNIDGWKLVPDTATEAMWQAGRTADIHPGDSYSKVWRAMFNEAPDVEDCETSSVPPAEPVARAMDLLGDVPGDTIDQRVERIVSWYIGLQAQIAGLKTELERQERTRSYSDGDCYLADCRITIGQLRRLCQPPPAPQPKTKS